MPRRDQIHEAVRNALVKDGWTITDDPFRINYEDADLYADLRVEKAADDPVLRRVLVIEVKSFLEASAIHGLEAALGQYVTYRSLLRAVAPDHELYLAVPTSVYYNEFQRKSFEFIVRDNRVALVVVDVPGEEIVTWID